MTGQPQRNTDDRDKSTSDPYGVNAFARAVEDMARSVAHAVGDGINEGARAVRAAAAAAGPTRAEKMLKKLRKSQRDVSGAALGLGIAAGVFAAIALLALVSGGADGAAPMLVFCAAFAVPAFACLAHARTLQRLVLYRSVLGERAYCRLDELAAAAGRGEAYVREDVRRLIRSGRMEGMRLSPDGARLFENGAAYSTYLAHCEAVRTAPAGSGTAAQPAAGAQRPDTLSECRAFSAGLEREAQHIADAGVRGQVEALRAQSERVADWLAAHPGSEGAVRRFAGYYMPTTLKLLHTYNEVGAQAPESAVAGQIQSEICGILYTINGAFTALQDSLLQDTAMDVSAEISALETVLAQDGLAPDGLTAQPQR